MRVETRHTPGPWAYRPKEYDDWGWVRTGYAVDADGNQPVVAQARGGTFNDEDFAEHRRNKTDPWEANARLIAAAPELSDFASHVQWEVVMGALEKWTKNGGSDLVALGIIGQGLLILEEARRAALSKLSPNGGQTEGDSA